MRKVSSGVRSLEHELAVIQQFWYFRSVEHELTVRMLTSSIRTGVEHELLQGRQLLVQREEVYNMSLQSKMQRKSPQQQTSR
jgi:hypothetical protein